MELTPEEEKIAAEVRESIKDWDEKRLRTYVHNQLIEHRIAYLRKAEAEQKERERALDRKRGLSDHGT